MNHAARLGLVSALDACRDGTTRVIVITGTGTAFCSGVDLKEALGRPAGWAPADTLENRRALWQNVQDEIRQHPAVIIAAVNGLALGGGMTLVNSCDLALAADDAEFGCAGSDAGRDFLGDYEWSCLARDAGLVEVAGADEVAVGGVRQVFGAEVEGFALEIT